VQRTKDEFWDRVDRSLSDGESLVGVDDREGCSNCGSVYQLVEILSQNSEAEGTVCMKCRNLKS
jgi:hypothetical protein